MATDSAQSQHNAELQALRTQIENLIANAEDASSQGTETGASHVQYVAAASDRPA